MPFALLLLLFVFLEVSGFVAMANAVGLLGVFGLIILGIVAGGFIIRTIGVASLARMQQRAQEGETVGQELGGLVLGFLGGVLLIVPGFLTDLIGLLLLIKPIQTLVWPRYGRQMASRMPDMNQSGQWRSPGRSNPYGSQTQPAEGIVIDAEAAPEAESNSKPGSSSHRSDNPWGG